MKRYWPVLLFSLLAAVVYADTAPVSLQSILKAAPKANPIGSDTHLTAMKGNTLVYVNATSIKPAVATTTSPGIVKVGTGLAVTADGTLNNTGLAGVASFKGRGGAVVPTTGDYTASMITGLSTVGISGSYTDLINQPAIPAAQVPSDWTASTGVARILNKPTVPTALSQLTQDATHRTVTDAEKATWNTSSASVNSVNGQTGTVTLTATDVGADPLGSATSVQTNLTAHAGATNNPHSVTKAQVGLGNVDNTSDANKPVSTATQAALDLKANTSSLGTAAAKDVPASGNASATQVVMGSDTRLAGDYSGATLKADDLKVKGPWVDVRAYGIKGDGSDEGSGIQAVWNASVGKTVVMPDGYVFGTSVTLTLPVGVRLQLGANATIKALAPMDAVINTPLDSYHKEGVISGGIIDCNQLANIGVHIRYAHGFTYEHSYITNYLVSAVVLGSSAAASTSYEIKLRNIKAENPSTMTAPTSSIALDFDNAKATDCVIENCVFIGAKTGVRAYSYNTNFVNVHVWNYLGNGSMDKGFVVSGQRQQFIGCIADTPMQYGFHITAPNNSFLSNSVINTATSPGGDNVAVGFYLENGASTGTSIIGTQCSGQDSTHRINADISGEVSNLKAYGNRTAYTTSTLSDFTSDIKVGSMQSKGPTYPLYVLAYTGSDSNGTTDLNAVTVETGANGTASNKRTSGKQTFFRLAPVYNQTSGTAVNTDLEINRTETAVGSGTQRLISAKVGGAEKFGVSNTGSVTATGLSGTAITDSTSTNSSTTAASATAVKAAYDLANGKPSLTSTAPNMDGVASAGSGITAARVDHVHPTDTTRAGVDNPTFTTGVTSPLFTSNAADGTHYVQPYNSTAYSGTCTKGMVQTVGTPAILQVCTADGTWGAVTGAVASVNGNMGAITTSQLGAYYPSGTDVAIADGGTGASTAAAALANLGGIGGTVGSTADRIPVASGTGGSTLKASGASIDPSTGVMKTQEQAGVIGALAIEDGSLAHWAGWTLAGTLTGDYYLALPTSAPSAGQVMVTGTPATKIVDGVSSTVVPVTFTSANTAGTYTPTYTAGTTPYNGVNSFTPGLVHYSRSANEVHVDGFVTADITANAGNATVFYISLPPSATSDLTSVDDCGGVVTSNGVSGSFGGYISADTTGNRARVQYWNTGATGGSMVFSFSFTYTVK